MTELPHFTRFARALALGAAVTTVAVAACNNTASTDANGASTSTTTAASSGNETPVTTVADSDAGATPPTESTQPVALSGSACTTVGENRANPQERWSSCTCTATSPSAATWQCSPPDIPIAGPLSPPELAA